MSITETYQRITCDDGREIASVLYRPEGRVKGAVLIGPATGIKKEFYTHFSTYLAENGYAVLTIDNRGIGESAKADLSQDDAAKQDWGQLDMPAALDFLMGQCKDVPYHVVGHSAGGQMVGLMRNHKSLSSVFAYASSSGCMKNMDIGFAIKANFFLRVFSPISNTLFGYTKSQYVGMGEPLPKKVAEQWSKWCKDYGYVKNDFNKAITTHYFDKLDMPYKWVHATDDPIANIKNVKDMMGVMPNLKSDVLTLNPKDHNLKALGHMDFFRRSNKQLWPIALDWLNQHNVQTIKPKPPKKSFK